MKLSEVPVSHYDLSHLLSSLSLSSSILPSPKNMKLDHPSLSLHAIIKSKHWEQHTPSAAYTEYSIHWVQHTLSTAYTAYCIIPTSTVFHSQPVSHLTADHVVLNSLHSHNHMLTNALSPSSHLASHRNYHLQIDRLQVLLPPPDWPPPSTPTISLDHCLQVYLQTRSITASQCISQLGRSQPPGVSPNSHDYGLHDRTIPASKCISKLAWSHPPSESPNSHQYSFELCTITASKCIYKLTRSRPQSASPNSLYHSLQVHLQPRAIAASKCITKLDWSRPQSVSPTSHNYRLQVHLQTRSIMMWWNGGPRKLTAHHEYSAACRMACEGNSWQWAVLARGV